MGLVVLNTFLIGSEIEVLYYIPSPALSFDRFPIPRQSKYSSVQHSRDIATSPDENQIGLYCRCTSLQNFYQPNQRFLPVTHLVVSTTISG